MKMETLSRDSLYLKQRLNLNIDVEFVRQGGKEGHTTADRWKVDSGKSTYNSTMCSVHVKSFFKKQFDLRAVEAFKEVGPKLIQQLVAIYRLSKTSFNCKNPCLRKYPSCC